MLAGFTQLLCARRAEIFRLLNIFFRASFAQNLRDLDAGRFRFRISNAMLTRSTLSDVVRYAQLTMDECTQFFVRGACRISGNFAKFSRGFRAKFASSRRWTRALSCIRTHADSEKHICPKPFLRKCRKCLQVLRRLTQVTSACLQVLRRLTQVTG